MDGIKNKKISVDDLSKINGGSSQAENCEVYCYNCKKTLGTYDNHEKAELCKKSHVNANAGHFCVIHTDANRPLVTPSKPSI